MTVFELGTTKYDDDIIQIKKALSHLETLCSVPNSYLLGKPVSKFGWTFFQLALKPVLIDGIANKFADMILRYHVNKPEEKLLKFLSDYFESRDCSVRLKLVSY